MVGANGKKKEKSYRFLENSFCFFREMCVREPAAAICFVLAVVSGVMLPYLSAGLPKLVLMGLEDGWGLSLFLGRLLVLAAALALVGVLRTGTSVYVDTRTRTISNLYILRIMKKRLSVDYEVLEDERFHDEAYAAYDSIYRHHAELPCGYTIWKDFLTAVLSVVLYGGILLTQSVGILILVLLPTLIASFLQKRARIYDKKLRHFAEAANRKMDYVARLTADFRTGKDVRIFDLSGWLLGILKKERRISEGYVKQWENAYLAANCMDSVLNFMRDGCAYVFLIVQIVQGEMAVSDFVWYMAMVAGTQQACSQLLSIGERLGRLNLDYGRIRQFLDSWEGTAFSGKRQLPDKELSDKEFSDKEPSDKEFSDKEFSNKELSDKEFSDKELSDKEFSDKELSDKELSDKEFSDKKFLNKEFSDKKKTQGAQITFRHVSFAYPESPAATLRDVSFTIRSGEKIALVGLNGAGKTTLVKLLCGLYHPSEGAILIDGRNVRKYDRESYYRMISAVFQNVELLPLSIAQNVASAPEAGTGQAKVDPDRVQQCLKLSGLWEKVESLPLKENTSLGRRVSSQAVDLSGGEKQKLWMARAIYKEAPILVLDEPTAALDPLAEQEVYERYREMSEGRTSVFISHRLSSTSFCDRIFFMEKGQITEIGSHQALLEKGGAYADLYRIQSQYYREEDDSICER